MGFPQHEHAYEHAHRSFFGKDEVTRLRANRAEQKSPAMREEAITCVLPMPL